MLPVAAMEISREALEAYSSTLSALEADAAAKLESAIDALDWGVGYERLKENRNIVSDAMAALAAAYSDAASALGAELFESVMAAEGVTVAPRLAEPISHKQASDDVRSSARHIFGGKGDVAAFKASCVKQLARHISMAANGTVALSCRRGASKGVRYARVPMGRRTCEFCVMLASRGFVYASEKTAGRLGQYHYKCDCRIVPGIDGVTTVEGYDPDAYYASYKDCRDALDARRELKAYRSLPESERKGTFAEHWQAAILAEMRTRTREWLNVGAPGVLSKEPGAKPWRKEQKTAQLLLPHGFDVRFIKELKEGKTPDAWLNEELCELKVPEAYSEKTTKNQFKKAIGKGTGSLVISCVENHAPVESVAKDIARLFDEGEFAEITNVLIVGVDGSLRRIKR